MRWILTDAAVSSYEECVHVRSDARAELLAELARAHRVELRDPRADGREVWRGRPPARLRFVVEPTPDACRVVRVEGSHRGAPQGFVQHTDHGRGPLPLGRQLATWRERRGLSPAECAALAGVTEQELAAVEASAPVAWAAVSRVARCLRVRVVVVGDE